MVFVRPVCVHASFIAVGRQQWHHSRVSNLHSNAVFELGSRNMAVQDSDCILPLWDWLLRLSMLRDVIWILSAVVH